MSGPQAIALTKPRRDHPTAAKLHACEQAPTRTVSLTDPVGRANTDTGSIEWARLASVGMAVETPPDCNRPAGATMWRPRASWVAIFALAALGTVGTYSSTASAQSVEGSPKAIPATPRAERPKAATQPSKTAYWLLSKTGWRGAYCTPRLTQCKGCNRSPVVCEEFMELWRRRKYECWTQVSPVFDRVGAHMGYVIYYVDYDDRGQVGKSDTFFFDVPADGLVAFEHIRGGFSRQDEIRAHTGVIDFKKSVQCLEDQDTTDGCLYDYRGFVVDRSSLGDHWLFKTPAGRALDYGTNFVACHNHLRLRHLSRSPVDVKTKSHK